MNDNLNRHMNNRCKKAIQHIKYKCKIDKKQIPSKKW